MSVAEQQLEIGVRWLGEQRRVVCALLIDAEGSSPFAPGAFMLIDAEGAIEGSITGGCVESDVVVNALEMVAGDGAPRLLTYGVSDAAAHEVGLMCGGTVEVFVHELERRAARRRAPRPSRPPPRAPPPASPRSSRGRRPGPSSPSSTGA